MSVLRRIAHDLELDRIGQRRTWVVRLPHGVHLVSLRQSPLGDDIVVDGKAVARADPWEYDRAVRFKIDDLRAEARFVTDTSAGTLRTDLYVDGVLVPAEEVHSAPARKVDWAPRLERTAYVFGASLILGGLVGTPLFDAVRQVVWLGSVLVLMMGLRAIDPLGAIAVTFDKMVEDRTSMMVAGSEIVAIAAIAADRSGLRRRIPFLRETRRLPRVLGWVAVAVVALAILAVS